METHPHLLLRDRGWECPRCARIWNPSVISCGPCEPTPKSYVPLGSPPAEPSGLSNLLPFPFGKKKP